MGEADAGAGGNEAEALAKQAQDPIANLISLPLQNNTNYNLPDGWYLTSAPTNTANWEADQGSDVWTVPVGGGFGKIVKIAWQPINLSIQGFYNVIRPEVLGSWSARLQVQFLFPK